MTESQAPDWDMTPYFTGVDGADYAAFVERLRDDVGEARARAEGIGAISDDVAGWRRLLATLEDLQLRFGHVGGYLGCMSAADSTSEAIQRQVSAMGPLRAELAKAWVAVRAGLRDASDEDFDTLVDDDSLRHARHYLERARRRAALAMSPELEGLNADLAIDGISAWGRLYGQVTGKLQFDLELPGGESRRYPVSMARTLLEDGDPAVRRAALEGCNRAFESVGDTMAACLNAISGTRLTLYRRRGIEHFLDPAAFDAAIRRETLETMLSVVRERQDVAHRYLRHKAKLLGVPRLGFQDLLAPLPGGDETRLEWAEAKQRVLSAFGDFYPALQQLARTAFDGHWIDHSPRTGKRPGGFCSSSALIRQSRIFMTFNGASGDVRTLAHELGHAFHTWVMRDLPPWQRAYPMTLAETASTFAEQLVSEVVLASDDASEADRLSTLDYVLTEAAVFLCNIPMRFDFEHELYTRRADGELSVSELKAIMLEKQKANFQDAVDPEQLDPWYWASKLHFFLTEISFYNFPYTFGYLFSLGIFERARAAGPDFLPRYEALLRRTGSAEAEEVAREALGVDLGEPDFWHASIDGLERHLERFLALSG